MMAARQVGSIVATALGFVGILVFTLLAASGDNGRNEDGLALVFTILIVISAAAVGVGAGVAGGGSVGITTGERTEYTASSDAPTSGYAIASLVLGILSIFTAGIFAGIPAIITGWIGLDHMKNPEVPRSGRGMALAGIWMGAISSVAFIVALIVIVILAATV